MFDIANNSIKAQGAQIKVIGVGGGGCNAVNTMISAGLTGVEYIVANTDIQALNISQASVKIQLGGDITKGLGAGANPEVGKQSAMEEKAKIMDALEGADMVFITAGMGGGTGTGAAPVISQISREMGALTVGVVTKPFAFEGKRRGKQAVIGLEELEKSVDSLIIIPNEKLLELAGENLSLIDTFKKADEVLLNAVQGISDLINNTGLINADFADVATVMSNKGRALMGTGTGTGQNRAIEAAKVAISSPLLEDISIDGATGMIVNISGSSSMTTFETNAAMNLIMESVDEDAEIIFGTVIDESLGEEVKVTVIATGLLETTHNAVDVDSNSLNLNVGEEVVISTQRVEPEQVTPVATSAPSLNTEAKLEVNPNVTEEVVNESVIRPSRAKSVAEKLGFMNFDEDEFDIPSYLRNSSQELR